MPDVISEYQRWKQQGEDLRVQAKEAMETRFRDLLAEAMHIAEEYKSDFGAPLKISGPITAFRYKASPKSKAKKGAAKAKASVKAAAKVEAAPPAKPNPKLAGLQKRLAAARKKLADAQAAGTATRLLEDRIYEIEDELRLAEGGAPTAPVSKRPA